jgi:hypothetical protein
VNLTRMIRQMFGHKCRCEITVLGRRQVVWDGDVVHVKLDFDMELTPSTPGMSFGNVTLTKRSRE